MIQQSVTPAATNGIRSVNKPGWWVVPPWPPGSGLCSVVRHFLRFTPRTQTSINEQLRYYQGYAAAIEAAPKFELTHPCDHWWYAELLDCAGRCVAALHDEQAEESRKVRVLPQSYVTRRRYRRAS